MKSAKGYVEFTDVEQTEIINSVIARNSETISVCDEIASSGKRPLLWRKWIGCTNGNEDNDRIRRLLKSEEETRADLTPASQTPPKPDSVPKTDGTTPVFTRPALDKDNMPLPAA